MRTHNAIGCRTLASLVLGLCALTAATAPAQQVTDPGVRKTSTDGGPPPYLPGLSPEDIAFYQDGMANVQRGRRVAGASAEGNGLGPRFNSNSCVSCHHSRSSAARARRSIHSTTW